MHLTTLKQKLDRAETLGLNSDQSASESLEEMALWEELITATRNLIKRYEKRVK
jgi:hypothetical protein